MAAQPVEWVLVVYYGPSAHRATYGRLANTKYTKDYIQLSRREEFLDALRRLFPATAGEAVTVPLTYKWPTGKAKGELVFNSADRPHLKWETSIGAPKVWKMSLSPSDAEAETIPGDPTHLDFEAAENELAMLADRGAGQPYLMAVKLVDEPMTLHLRAYLRGASNEYNWADLGKAPPMIQELAAETSQSSALAWKTFVSGGVVPSAAIKPIISMLGHSDAPVALLDDLDADIARELAAYLRRPGYGLFFDPAQNHDAWMLPAPLPARLAAALDVMLEALDLRSPAIIDGDAAAEVAEPDPTEVEAFHRQIEAHNYSVPDSSATIKTRGSAQRAFANAVKGNYEERCAITGIATKEFLVASHIVPWSKDQSIRLDPSNGICLSLLMDRAFENGYLLIEDDLTIRINSEKVGDDLVLRGQLAPYDGRKLTQPKAGAPKPEYLRRRRALVASVA